MEKREKITRVAYIVEAGFEYFISIFVTGTMLGYLLDTLGFSDALQGIISTVATFTCGAQLFALVLKGRRKKKIATIGHVINQAAFVLLYFLPIFELSPNLKTALLMIFLFVGHIINNAVNPAKITWLMSSVPYESRGGFTAIKEMISLSGGIAVSLIFGRIADVYRDADGMPTKPYYVICAAALILMMAIHTVSLIISDEKPLNEERSNIRKTVKSMVKNRDLLKIIGVGIIWNVASAFSVSFFASYLREELAFSFTLIATITTVGSVVRIIASPLFGRLGDKYSFANSMTLAFASAAIAFLSVAFTSPETRWIYLVYICLHSFAMAGINSGVINLIYDYVAPEDRAVAMGVKNALGGIIAFFVALLAGMLLGAIQGKGGFNAFGINFYAQQVLALISFLITLALIIYMRLVVAPIKKLKTKL